MDEGKFEVKLCDFGLATFQSDTTTGSYVGSELYMPPVSEVRHCLYT